MPASDLAVPRIKDDHLYIKAYINVEAECFIQVLQLKYSIVIHHGRVVEKSSLPSTRLSFYSCMERHVKTSSLCHLEVIVEGCFKTRPCGVSNFTRIADFVRPTNVPFT
jgi:hypothetical protein